MERFLRNIKDIYLSYWLFYGNKKGKYEKKLKYFFKKGFLK
jgi:hypothetical protein